MKTVFKGILIGVGLLIVLLAVLSVTLFNKQFKLTRITSLMREARIAFEQYDFSYAAEYYRMVIAIDKKNVQAYLNLAKACELDDYIEDALYYLELGMQKTDQNPKLRDEYNRLLAILNGDEEPTDEEDDWEDGLEDNPEDVLEQPAIPSPEEYSDEGIADADTEEPSGELPSPDPSPSPEPYPSPDPSPSPSAPPPQEPSPVPNPSPSMGVPSPPPSPLPSPG